MTSTLSKIFIFAVGAAIGSAVTWKLIKDTYSRRAEEAIADMKEYLENKTDKNNEVEDDIENQDQPETEEIYVRKEQSELFAKTSLYRTTDAVKEVDTLTEPYVIAPEEFGECDYDTESLTYYADGVLTDDCDNPVSDIENTVGLEALNSFGEYEDDSVFVRNDRLKTDYEILLDERKYTDVDRTTNPFATEE